MNMGREGLALPNELLLESASDRNYKRWGECAMGHTPHIFCLRCEDRGVMKKGVSKGSHLLKDKVRTLPRITQGIVSDFRRLRWR